MQHLFQLGVRERRPMWLRLLALVAILVVTVMSTVQVAHTHPAFSIQKPTPGHSAPPATDDHCPLCVAMHSALAAPQLFAPEPTLSMQRLDSVAAEAERLFRWRFELASRPPPAMDLA